MSRTHTCVPRLPSRSKPLISPIPQPKLPQFLMYVHKMIWRPQDVVSIEREEPGRMSKPLITVDNPRLAQAQEEKS